MGGLRKLSMSAVVAAMLSACGGSGTAAPPARFIGTPSPLVGTLGYAVESGTNRANSSTLEFSEYPTDGTAAIRTITFGGGQAIRFDTLGKLWLDAGGDFQGTRADGTSTGDMYGLDGSLRAFGPDDTMYVAAAAELGAYSVAYDLTTQRTRVIPTSTYACSADGDAAGTIYIAPCTAGPNGSIWSEVDAYAPGSATAPITRNTSAIGPLTVGHDGTLYAMYAGAIGVWPQGTFGTGAPPRTIVIPSGMAVKDIAADRSGNVYATVYTPAPVGIGSVGTGALLYVAGGTAAPATLMTGAFGSLTTVP